MATRVIYPCGCAEMGEWFWPCDKHKPKVGRTVPKPGAADE